MLILGKAFRFRLGILNTHFTFANKRPFLPYLPHSFITYRRVHRPLEVLRPPDPMDLLQALELGLILKLTAV